MTDPSTIKRDELARVLMAQTGPIQNLIEQLCAKYKSYFVVLVSTNRGVKISFAEGTKRYSKAEGIYQLYESIDLHDFIERASGRDLFMLRQLRSPMSALPTHSYYKYTIVTEFILKRNEKGTGLRIRCFVGPNSRIFYTVDNTLFNSDEPLNFRKVNVELENYFKRIFESQVAAQEQERLHHEFREELKVLREKRYHGIEDLPADRDKKKWLLAKFKLQLSVLSGLLAWKKPYWPPTIRFNFSFETTTLEGFSGGIESFRSWSSTVDMGIGAPQHLQSYFSGRMETHSGIETFKAYLYLRTKKGKVPLLYCYPTMSEVEPTFYFEDILKRALSESSLDTSAEVFKAINAYIDSIN